MERLRLRQPEADDEEGIRAAVREFRRTDPGWTFAPGLEEHDTFTDFLARLRRWQGGFDLPGDWVASTFLVASVENQIVGRLSLRHRLNSHLLQYGGHVGFGVVPSHRRRGFATDMLRLALPVCRSLGLSLPRILLTCDDSNFASQRVIEACGGVLDNVVPRSGGGRTRRYWITLESS